MFDDLTERGVPMRVLAEVSTGSWSRGYEHRHWALILTGVGLNAAAQLLLKVATRPLAHFSDFSADTLGKQRDDPGQEPSVLGRHGLPTGRACACGSRPCPRRR